MLFKNFSSRDVFEFFTCASDSEGTDDSGEENKADSSVAKSEENSWLLGILETEEEMVRIIGALLNCLRY